MTYYGMPLETLLAFAVVYVVFAVGLLYVVFGGFLYGAMWMPLPKRRVERMLELAELSKGKVVFDLGAGYGNMAFKAAASCGSVVAVEVDSFKAWWIRRQIKLKGLTNVSCVKANLVNLDLFKADVLLCYLSDGLMEKIVEKPLKKGALIVSCSHKIKKLAKFVDKDNLYPIYVYEV